MVAARVQTAVPVQTCLVQVPASVQRQRRRRCHSLSMTRVSPARPGLCKFGMFMKGENVSAGPAKKGIGFG